MKPATFFISSTESSIKIKVRSHGTLFLILLTSAVICKQRLLRLCNIFKTANAITLSKTVLESPYEVLQGS